MPSADKLTRQARMEALRVARADRLNAAWDSYKKGHIPVAQVHRLMDKYAATTAKCPWYIDAK